MFRGDGVMAKKEKRRGRPSKLEMPEPILGATPEEIAEMVLKARPPVRWRYMEEAERVKLERKDGD